MATTKIDFDQIKTGLPTGGDINYDNVSLLLHMNGTDGSTTFTDSSSANRSISTSGGASISTDHFKFGGSSFEGDGSNKFLTVPASNDFVMTGDYTIEAWFRADATTGDTIISCWPNVTDRRGAFGLWLYQNKLRWDTRPANNITYNLDSTSTINTGQWYHSAIVRSGATQTLYLNGVAESSNTMSDTVGRSGDIITVGKFSGHADYMDGYIDELRITEGIARYTSNFSVLTEEFDAFQSNEGKSLVIGSDENVTLQ